MDFLILRPLSLKTGYHFFEGGGGGSKVFARKAPSSGEANLDRTTAGRMVVRTMRSFRSAVRTLVGGLLAAARLVIYPTGVQTDDKNYSGQLHYQVGVPFGYCLP